MLTTTPHRYYILDEESDFIHNYYERRVLQEIVKQSERARMDREFLADVACVALNRLLPRYIRHDVDMTFFMSPQDMQEIETKVSQAVSSALAYVESRDGTRDVAVAESGESGAKPKPKKLPGAIFDAGNGGPEGVAAGDGSHKKSSRKDSAKEPRQPPSKKPPTKH